MRLTFYVLNGGEQGGKVQRWDEQSLGGKLDVNAVIPHLKDANTDFQQRKPHREPGSGNHRASQGKLRKCTSSGLSPSVEEVNVYW